MALESAFQAKLIKRIEKMFPGCMVLKNDTGYKQGIPDLTILHGNRWAVLECKRKRPTKESDFEPNQEWYIEQLDNMSFSACIYPENMEEVLDDLQSAFTPRRGARLP
jgi:hypothetical protein